MRQAMNKMRWAVARLTFMAYLGFSIVTLIGGFLTAPLMTWYFFGDWRFWRHWEAGRGLMPHAWRVLSLMFKHERGFMLSVPLTSPPRSTPDACTTTLQPDWRPGHACGSCSNCCRAGGYSCPLLDESAGLCHGYDSFYWRYFNCGRFPSTREEIAYYDCRKWVLAPGVDDRQHPSGVQPAGASLADAPCAGNESVPCG